MGSIARRLRRTTLPRTAAPLDRTTKTRGPRAVVVYGAGCTWWGTLADVKTNAAGLPCCPHCSGVLFETTADDWNKGAARQAAVDGAEYLEVVKWLRTTGRCWSSFTLARDAYRQEQADG